MWKTAPCVTGSEACGARSSAPSDDGAQIRPYRGVLAPRHCRTGLISRKPALKKEKPACGWPVFRKAYPSPPLQVLLEPWCNRWSDLASPPRGDLRGSRTRCCGEFPSPLRHPWYPPYAPWDARPSHRRRGQVRRSRGDRPQPPARGRREPRPGRRERGPVGDRQHDRGEPAAGVRPQLRVIAHARRRSSSCTRHTPRPGWSSSPTAPPPPSATRCSPSGPLPACRRRRRAAT